MWVGGGGVLSMSCGQTRPARPGGEGFLGHAGLVCSAGGRWQWGNGQVLHPIIGGSVSMQRMERALRGEISGQT